MTDQEVGKYWNDNAEAWTQLARAGFDLYRNHFNTPAFFDTLPNVHGKRGLDIGCGEGYNTRLLAACGAHMDAVDIAPVFVAHAQAAETQQPVGIRYQVASATELPFEAATFDFATAFMCLMDVSDLEKALAEAHRVLKPNGFLQFSIVHPCFNTHHRRNLRRPDGVTYAIEVGQYFDKINRFEEWIFGAAPMELRNQYRPFRIPIFHHTLSEWVNLLIATGFAIEGMYEPRPSDELVAQMPYLQDAQVVSYFLHIRVRK